MKVSIVRGGGVTGLVTTTEVESDSLSADDSGDLAAKIGEAGVFDLPPRLAGETGGADQMHYALTVEDEDRKHTVVMSEATMPEPVRALIEWVDSSPARQETAGRPSPPPEP